MSKKIKLTEGQHRYILENAPVVIDNGNEYNERYSRLSQGVDHAIKISTELSRSLLGMSFGELLTDIDEWYKRVDAMDDALSNLDRELRAFDNDIDELKYDREQQGQSVDDVDNQYKSVVELEKKLDTHIDRMNVLGRIVSDLHTAAMDYDNLGALVNSTVETLDITAS